MKRTVTIEGDRYTLDMDRAKELGVLKKERKAITKLQVGDVFGLGSRFDKGELSTRLLLVPTLQGKWHGLGHVCGLHAWNTGSSDDGYDTQQMLAYLNDQNDPWTYIGNIDKSAYDLIANLPAPK